MSGNSVGWFGVTLLAVVPASGTPRRSRRGDDTKWIESH
jgi:hypothetical protein